MKIGTCQGFADWSETAAETYMRAVLTRLGFRILPFLAEGNDTSLERLLFPSMRICCLSYVHGLLGNAISSQDGFYWGCSELMEFANSETGKKPRMCTEMLGFVGHAFLTTTVWEDEKHGGPTLPSLASDVIDGSFELMDMSAVLLAAVEADINAVASSADAKVLLEKPLWCSFEPPQAYAKALPRLQSFFKSGKPEWGIWGNLIDAVIDGKRPETELVRKAAKLGDDVWEGGPLKVWQELFQEDSNDGQLVSDKVFLEPLHVRLELILGQPMTSEKIAIGVARSVSEAIETYLAESGENSLPEEFIPLDSFPDIMLRIAGQVNMVRPSGELIEANVISAAQKIAELEAQLAASKPSISDHFSRTLVESAAKSIGDWKLYGALFAALNLWVDSEALAKVMENLSGSLREVFPDKPAITGPEKPIDV